MLNQIKQLFAKAQTGNIAIVDVRTHEEHQQIAIPNTLHIPLDELAHRIHELNTFDEVHFFCKAGRRALLAQEIAKESTKSEKFHAISQGVFEIADSLL